MVVSRENSMWLRICRLPDRPVEGVTLGQFQVGAIVEFGTQLASVFLAEGWAKPVTVKLRQHIGALAPSRLLLIVDDDPSARSLMTDLFNESGYAVVVAENGRQGLERLCDYSPDLVLLDLQMPVMDGWRFRAEQQHLPNLRLAHVPVVVVTGTTGADASADALHASGCVEKPFDPDNLLSLVTKAIIHDRPPPERRLRA